MDDCFEVETGDGELFTVDTVAFVINFLNKDLQKIKCLLWLVRVAHKKVTDFILNYLLKSLVKYIWIFCIFFKKLEAFKHF